jgi:hypothetical protein
MKLGIIIPTYQRKDNQSPFLLKRALHSILNQTKKEYKVFVIGDRYENENELKTILDSYPKEKFYVENLPIAVERDNYADKWALWSYGGVNATNYGIDLALNDGFDFLCRLDHDDFWDKTHLEEILNCIEQTHSDWMCTKSQYIKNLIYPFSNCNKMYCDYEPKPRQLIHSSVCMNFKKIPLKYRDLFKETGKSDMPSDADMWIRVSQYCKDNNLKTTLINKITCFHIDEGYERN